jgi:hypothetical protein
MLQSPFRTPEAPGRWRYPSTTEAREPGPATFELSRTVSDGSFMLSATHTIPTTNPAPSHDLGDDPRLQYNGLPYLDQYEVDIHSATGRYQEDFGAGEESLPPVVKVDNSLTPPNVFAETRLCGKFDTPADGMNAIRGFLDGLDDSESREGCLPEDATASGILSRYGAKVDYLAQEVRSPLREPWTGSGATEPVLFSAHEASLGYSHLPRTTFTLHHYSHDRDERRLGEAPESCTLQGNQEDLQRYLVHGKDYGFTDKVAEFDGGSYLSCGYISTVGKFGYEKTAITMPVKGMIHVLAIGPRLFDVTLQRYSGMTPNTASTSLRGVDIPSGCDSPQDIHALIHQRFDDLPRNPEYYGFSCVIGAYADDDEQFYARIVAELCRCLYEALICQ